MARQDDLKRYIRVQQSKQLGINDKVLLSHTIETLERDYGLITQVDSKNKVKFEKKPEPPLDMMEQQRLEADVARLRQELENAKKRLYAFYAQKHSASRR